MQVIKSAGHITGAKLTGAEKKALKIEVRKMVREELDSVCSEINAAILWRLHNTFKWGPLRLRRFYKGFRNDTKELLDRYELSEDDSGFINQQALKEYGIDIQEWEKEFKDGGID